MIMLETPLSYEALVKSENLCHAGAIQSSGQPPVVMATSGPGGTSDSDADEQIDLSEPQNLVVAWFEVERHLNMRTIPLKICKTVFWQQVQQNVCLDWESILRQQYCMY